MNKTIAYSRVSTLNKQDLGLEVQVKAFKQYNPSRVYQEKASGRKEDRQILKLALAELGRGDTLLIYKLDRLSRSTRQLVNLMAELNEKGILT